MFSTPNELKSPAQGLLQDGLSLLEPARLLHALTISQQQWHKEWPTIAASWDRLPPDLHLKDGGAYRKRRHACFVQSTQTRQLTQVPHRAHWQPTDYNALHGGFERWFEPVESAVSAEPIWNAMLTGFGGLFHKVRSAPRWHIEAHQFRIDTASGVGRPTPEGAHRDGVDFVVVMLVQRHGVKGGETRVFEAHGSRGERFLMKDPMTALLLDDARVIHETTPILPAHEGDLTGFRDTLVLTYRASGFQAP